MSWIVFDICSKQKRLSELKNISSAPDFWSTPNFKDVLQEIKSLEDIINSINKAGEEAKYLKEVYEIISENDPLFKEIDKKLHELGNQIKDLEFKTLLDDKFDNKNAFFSIQSGAGGTDACDFASMLFRMYCRWFDKKGFNYQVTSMLKDEEAGIKSVTIYVTGNYVYGQLKAEVGVHRLVRISPFNANNKRQTSFVSCEVMPEMDEIQVNINTSDLRIETFKSGGAGGQHVNKTESAVRIIHTPTNIQVECQNERSQILNRKVAMKILSSKLYKYYEQQNKSEIQKIQGTKSDITFGAQIRSYTLHPYQLVKDHRTNLEVSNIQAVLDGEIDEYIEAFLKYSKRKM
ncbi:MAG: peptide chain release factor 2 [Planctomycetes bacterium]|nr:peptide chain release factor 2 [Planctomycetota bacterium]